MSEETTTIRELIGSTIQVPADELDAVLTDPDSGEPLYAQRASSQVSVETAIATAWAVHTDGTWSDRPPADRAAALRSLQHELTSRAVKLGHADSLDNGVPRATTTGLCAALTVMLELAAARIEGGFGHEAGSSTRGTVDQWRLPWGPAAVFLPWNAPSLTAMVKMSDALAAGCPTIIKPSEWAPHFSGPFAEAVASTLPAGVVQIVHGDRSVGEQLIGDRRVAAVSYTGGVAGGTAVAEACARQLKPADLELSGNNPVVVLPDAEPQTVVDEVVTGMLMLNGQYCVGPRRLILPVARVDEYLAILEKALAAARIGATTDPTSVLGPLAHEKQHRQVERQLAELEAMGCPVHRFGTMPDLNGHFVAPTVVLADQAPQFTDEVFGPVLMVRTYGTLADAIEIANDHPYGLSAHVFGDRDVARDVGRRLRAGLVKVNWVMEGPEDISPVASMWGASGIGSFGDGEGARFFSGSRFVG